MRIYMALAQNRLIAPMWAKLRTKVGVRFTRFVGVAIVSLATSEILLSICNGVFHMTATPAALISTFSGAAVSYVLSRWAWERKGRPDVLRETVPFWVISALVWVILWLATKLGYHMASWLGLHGFKHVLLVDLVYLVANFVTFALRFVIFHYVLFADRTTAARAAATGPDAVPPGTREAPRPAEAPHSAAATAAAEAQGPSAASAVTTSDGAPAAQKQAGQKRDTAKRPTPATRSTGPQAAID
jgi:putative flippase GtrA